MIWTIMQTLNVSALEAVLVNGPLVLCDGLGRGGGGMPYPKQSVNFLFLE